MRGGLLVALLAAAALGVAAAPAQAATLSIGFEDSCQGDEDCERYMQGTREPVVRFDAAPGERNRVTVSRAGDLVRVHDDGAPIFPAAPCQAIDERTATCPAGSPIVPGFQARLGDQDDTLTVSGRLGTRAALGGGDGADVLRGGRDGDSLQGDAGRDRLDGGPGGDSIESGAGADRVHGGTGDDFLFNEGGGVDDMQGGKGNDRLFVYSADGSRLSGGEGSDDLEGGAGADRLHGGDGRDRLSGGGGRDEFHAGAGTDTLSANDGRRDAIDCGPGRDRLFADPSDRHRNCERRKAARR